MDYLESLFGVDTFNKTLATAAADQYLKYTRETYRKHLKQNDRYERPLMIPEREWKALIEDAKEKKLTDEGKTPFGPRRLTATSKITEVRLAKCGQHRLGKGGYLKLQARIGDEFGIETIKEDFKLGYKYDYKAVVEHRKSLGQIPRTTLQDKGSNTVNECTSIGEQYVYSSLQPGDGSDPI